MARENGSLGERHAEKCDVYWVDSSIQNEDYGNADVLDDADEYEADRLLLADTMGDYEETVDSIYEGLELVDDHPYDGDVIIPLQAPYDECYLEFEGESDYYAIGGLNRGTASQRIEASRTVRGVAGYDIHLHGLGWGPKEDNELVKAVHRNPDLLDSIDYSTPIQSSTGAMAGDERMSVTAAEAGARLVRDLRRFTPNVTFEPDPAEVRENLPEGQSGLEELA